MNGKWLLDTNLLVYAYDSHDLRKQSIAQDWIKESIRSGQGVIPAQVLSEFYVAVTQRIRNPILPEDAQKCLQLFNSLSSVFKEKIAINNIGLANASHRDIFSGATQCPKIRLTEFAVLLPSEL